ncbi:hypothetical protein PVAND_005600 [Polypedilum vanderplanki]|uniref:AAA+ ATPase domain-containing protein n=1 Tax=Polypedilum vanderplanki TaxID=319348 RepID=A0A9J6C0Z9_POLVA|nr:hypothetical protein PVAND_005600 [Polypedilum vanderplanki]
MSKKPDIDPEQDIKHLLKTTDVSATIKTIARLHRPTLTVETKEERREKLLLKSKNDRSVRASKTENNERYILEVASMFFNIHEDTLFQSYIDSQDNIDLLKNIFERNGSLKILIQYQLEDAPNLESGRFDPKLKYKQVMQGIFSSGRGKKILGECVAVYRLDNSTFQDMKNIENAFYFMPLPTCQNTIESFYEFFLKVLQPTLQVFKDYGECTEREKQNFLYGLSLFLQFLKSTQENLATCRIEFPFDNDFYKGFLLNEIRIKEASKNREHVSKCEAEFTHWMNQIRVAISQGTQLIQENVDHGPLKELEHWRKMLAKFCHVSEFVKSKMFNNYYLCLKLSKSKILLQWMKVDEDLRKLLVEATDNVRFLQSIQEYWNPLYKCEPNELCHHIKLLLKILHGVYSTSNFFNTSLRITSFLSKVSNQIVNTSRKYLTSNFTKTIWTEDMKILVKKINECKNMVEIYRNAFSSMVDEIVANGEKPLECSPSYLFDRLELFINRLCKIREVMEICLRYQVLNQIRIGGMELFSNKIYNGFEKIAKTSYDPLEYRIKQFEQDFVDFQVLVSTTEVEMEQFLIHYLEEIPTVESKILALKRFEKLDLMCLGYGKRYISIAESLLKEMEDIKDKYNEERAKPPMERGIPPYITRIKWARTLHKKIQEPLKYLTKYECVYKHKVTQQCVKMYNFLTPILDGYETTTHKAWYTYVDQIRSRLECPILKKHAETNHYIINLNPYVLQVVKECESMMKFGLQVPKSVAILTYCKDRVFDAYNILKMLVQRNNLLRKSIKPIFLPLMRIHLIKLERIFAPAFSQITWLTFDIENYFINIARILEPLEEFVKTINDINDAQIETLLEHIGNMVLIHLPEQAVTPEEFLDMNLEYRKNVEKIIQIKSQAAEKSTVELINKFIEKAEMVPYYDNSGKYQLPYSKIDESNRRFEEIKPINKFDWLSFDKIFKAVGYATPEDNEINVFKDFDGLHYDVTLLHIDCMELFAYYNHRVISVLAKCSKRSMEILKTRSYLTSVIRTYDCDNRESEPLLITNIELKIPDFKLVPDITKIQYFYDQVLLNILETNIAVSTWGKQGKSRERCLQRTVLSELIYPKDFFDIIGSHKDVTRYRISFDDGVLQLQPEIKKMLNRLYNEYKYLWVDDLENQIEAFVQSNPLTADIRDKLVLYDKITAEILKLNPVICFGILLIDRHKMIEVLEAQSKIWKKILGKKLCEYYRIILDRNVDFINAQNKILARELKDLDDCRIAMDCMKVIRDNFIDIDQSLNLIEQTYAVFLQFKLNVPAEDFDRVDGLRYQFNSMLQVSKVVGEKVLKMQAPLLNELTAGVEKFKNEIITFDREFIEKGPMIEGIPAKEASERVILFETRLDQLQHQYEVFSSGEAIFGLPVNEYPILTKRKRDINFLNRLYKLYLDVMYTVDEYFTLIFNEVDMEKINAEIQEFVNRCRTLPKGMKDWPAFIDLKKKIDDFYECCPLIELMASNAMKERHWEMLEKVVKYRFNIEDSNFTLGYVMKAPLLEHKEEIEEICVGASKEQDIEIKLQTVIKDWKEINMPLALFKNRGELLIKAADLIEIISKLEDSLMVMSSLSSNRFNAPFKKDIMLWLHKLSDTNEILERWLQVQSLWLYLEAVFVGGDISRQLPQEAKRFGNIDKGWMKIMYKTRDNPNVIEICTGDDIVSNGLKFLLEQLELCQKSLTVYLESKRLIFPRFFFISDPVLLEILGQASDPNSIQPHLLSIFDGVARVGFDKEKPDTIISMYSSNGEKIPLLNSVRCIGLVEIWIGKLLESVLETVKNILGNVGSQIGEAKFDYKTFLPTLCAQAQLICIQLVWTKDAEYALSNCKIDRKIMAKKNMEMQDMLNFLVDQTVMDLTKLQRICCETLVTIHVHQRDIFDELVRNKVKTANDFEWQKQARFYYDFNMEEILVKITDIEFTYQNEYLGVTDRLAITPLTDRCYITLAQAIGMNMGGAPAGPAGTGKTETTKDMGRALGKLVVVFNCSDQMDFRGLGRIFKGLAQSGSWGCFDEFNRIELPVLSVAAQQIYIVLNARKEKQKKFIFSDGDTVKLNSEFGLFITMNPGYAGRQELPENLKIQFRTCAMMIPDRQIIMRVKLASCGFRDNVKLAAKFYTLYKLCEEQLSKQVHYDFGLRNILSVLRTLGAAKRAATGKLQEDEIVMQVLRDMNLSKLVDEDEPLFLSLIADLFPSLKLQTSSRKDLQTAISEAVTNLKLINHPAWNLKVVQLYETSLVRHGLMILGPTGAGKSKCITTLLSSLTIQGLSHKELRMNPKAITAPQMFGRLDVTTNDWTDGIFSVLWRRTLKFKTDFVWLTLDGPVDAVWIENLNSVLDDNKTLTLANGDRIVMSPNCKLVFEPDAIDNASPATVSRMGMVFMSSSVMPWDVILDGWLLSRSEDQEKIIRKFFNKIYDDLHLFVQTKLSAKMKLLEAIYIRQTCDILIGLLDDKIKYSEAHLERIFLFALMWSLGAVLELEDRDKMEQFVLSHPSKMKWPNIERGESIFEFLVDQNGNWQHWNTQIEEYVYPSTYIPDYSSILVPNVDNVRTAFLIDTIAKQNKSVLLIGEQGTAKTVMIKSYMSNYNPEEHLSKSFNFSSATTPNMFQRIIESYVEKRIGLTYGPPQMRKMTIFIDDINMPIVNEWGDQVTNEIVRQLMEQSGFYSLDRPGDFITVVDIQLLAAMIHAGGGRNDIPARLKRQFNVFNCTLPSNKSMDKIFGVIGNGYFCPSRFNMEIVDFISRLIPLTRKLWQQTKTKMLPTPAKFHYIFNLRDLSRIWGGMLKIESKQCQNIGALLKLWSHECTRVIADRFINTEDREWFSMKMKSLASEELRSEFEYFPKEDVYFVDFLRDEPDEPIEDVGDDEMLSQYFLYEEIPSFEVVTERIYSFMTQYNLEVRGSKLDLVLFQDGLVHLMIISRILRTSRGNALLVGVGGSGKQSLTKLASYIAGYRFHQVTLTRAYNLNNFADEFRFLYRVAGVAGQGICFIFTDNDIKDESFLEYLNNVLSSGEIANLYPKDELDEILNELIPIMKKADPKRIPTQENLYDFFISRARNNLHIVLCFSPIGEKFRNRALKFPGLISGCTIDWFQKWPMDALVSVSTHILKDYSIECTYEVKNDLIEMMAYVHDNVSETCVEYFERFRRQASVTPKSFLSFLSGYKEIYKERLATIQDQSMKMSNGLGKLKEAAESIDILKKEMEVKKVEISIAEQNAQEVIQSVEKSRQIAGAAQIEVQQKKEIQEVLVENINKAREIAEVELEKTLPQLKLAEDALKTIKSQDIAVVRRLGKPPYLITVIMDCVLILCKLRLDPVKMDFEKNFLKMSWNESIKLMSDVNFLKKVRDFERDTIDAETIDLLQPYFKFPQYTLEAAMAACGQVAGLLKWTRAMADFYKVNVNVIPLKADLAVKQNQLKRAEHELSLLEDALEKKNEEVKEAEREFKKANDELQKVKDDAALLQSKLDAAHAMITGLSDERVRWTEQIVIFKKEIQKLVGDVLILCGFLSYTGPFNQLFRALLQNTWQKELKRREIPFSINIDVVERLTDTATIGEWNLQGLPNDELSIQNGIIVTQAHRYPLLIDPQSQGKAWIKQKEKENLILTTLNHKYFRNHLEDAIQQGLPMLIEDIGEELDPCMDNVLEKNYIKMGMSYKVKVGDKEIDIHKDFKLFITTKLPNPMYPPEVAARTSIIDFTVTMKGLEDQLLGKVILSERREIEAERVQLDVDVTANKKLSKELEANLLYKLSTTEGSLLDDLSVMEVLNTSKAKAIEIKEKLESAEETKATINTAREEFRPVAARGSVLYFLIVKMSLVNNMYQTSLVQFLERFDYSLKNSDKSPITYKRINSIIDYLSYDIFKYKSRGLYETHKFLFVLLMALDIDLQRDRISFEEFQTFIKGGAALDINSVSPKPCRWITDITWLNLVQLSFVPLFHTILDQIKANDRTWKAWYEKNAPEEEIFPDGYNSLDAFRKLLIIRSFCLDRTLSQSRKYIASSLGEKFADPVVLNYEIMLEESRPLTPIICFLSMGSDPTPSIESLAKKNQIKVSAISMGQGQEVHARKLMEKSLKEGSWVLLQNCHLGLEYMNELTQQLMELERIGEGYDEMFRLWITTEVHPNFPITMLQMAIKFTNEPPSGMRAGLKRTYNSMSMELFDYSDSPLYLPLIYSTSTLHTTVQERRKFGALGWNIPYEFNSSDWLASCLFMQKHLEEVDTDISWKTVNYMIGEVQYGGRVTDDYDKRLLNCLARTYFNDKMFDEDFEFYKGYKIVVRKTTEEYMEYFDTMSTTDPPNLYGLHANADITFQTNKTKEILDTIISVQPKESSGGAGETREAAVTRQVKDMQARFPPLYDEFEVKQRLTKEITPMNIFLRQEIDRMQKIIKLVKSTLTDLLLAIEGTIIMSETLRDAFDNIYDARVPTIWKRGSWLASTLGFWFSELIERNVQFSDWCFKVRPKSYWMTGFFNPQGFLTAMRQETARANVGWALDKVILQNEVMKFSLNDIKDYPRSGVYVHGLFLDGAGWNRRENRLIEATNKILYTQMPIIRIYANNVFEGKGQNLYECPVYKKANRTDLNFITALHLATKEHPDHWILRGVALLCDNK